MELTVKHYNELSTDELFEILKLRSAVFVVEQNCIYQDIDDFDRVSYHLFFRDENGIEAYLRLLPANTVFDTVSIGRVTAVRRRCGLGTEIVKAGITAAKDKFNADSITIEAQTYAKKLYENLGFVQVSDEFIEDGIPHIKMKYEF